jgi:archaetidylinositol phosphate synthase
MHAVHVWRERLSRWFTPAAARCPISPNAITVLALVLNMAAALALAFGRSHPWLFLAAMLLVGTAGLADAFDGIVARVQGKTTRFGDFLDHLADRISDSLVLIGWAWGSGVRPSLILAATFVVLINGYSGTQLEASFGKRSYEGLGRGEFVLALVIFPIVSYGLAVSDSNGSPAGPLRIAEWLTLLLIAAALLGTAQRVRLAAHLSANPQGSPGNSE